jgi:hypothetical protein
VAAHDGGGDRVAEQAVGQQRADVVRGGLVAQIRTLPPGWALQKSWARLIAAPPAAQPSWAMGICRVSERNPSLLISHAVSDGIRKPVHDT